MSFIKECFEEHGRVLIDKLQDAGFSVNQVIDFLPEAASDIERTMCSSGSSESIDNSIPDNSEFFMNLHNVDLVEHKYGVSLEQVKKGFEIINPFFIETFLNRE